MSWISGYTYLIAAVTVVATLAWTSGQFIIAISNTLNIVQINSQGANVGVYVALIIMGTIYNLLGVKFSGYLNKFMGNLYIITTYIIYL